MSGAYGPPVVIGFGNPLLGDDGVGLRVIDELRRLSVGEPGSLPPGTRLVRAGAPSTDLLPVIRDARALLLIDAVDAGRPPGSVTVARGERVSSTVGRGDIGELLVATRLTGRAPGAVALVELQVAAMDPGIGLSAPVEAAVARAAQAARRELVRLAGNTRSADRVARSSRQPAAEVLA